jgi:subtilisin family serine protease
LKTVVENVRAAGIVVVVSAGNSGPLCSTISDVPSFYDASFTIGATTSIDTIASFSSRGSVMADGSGRLKPDLSAPGVGVRVARPPATYSSSFSGTSGSAPHVTGAVALLWSAVPQLIGQVAATTSVLERTAVPLTSTQDCGGFPGASVPNPVFGWGRLDVAVAVTAAVSPPTRSKAILTPRRGSTRRVLPRP